MNFQLPKKSLGQHWLYDAASLNAIAASAEISPKDTVLEIGPGKGSLTQILIKTGAQVIALEIDESLTSELKNKLIDDNLQIEQGDIRNFNLTNLPAHYKIAANIPYYLTAYLLRLLVETPHKPLIAVLLVQKEVAERVAAEPGEMSFLSVSVQLYYDVELGRRVPAKLFTPAPKVDSQVLILKRRSEPLFNLDRKQFFRLVKAGFANRRKTLINSLAGSLQISKTTTAELLARARIESDKRPQELSLKDWFDLYNAYKSLPSY